MSANVTRVTHSAVVGRDVLARAWGQLLEQSDTVADAITLALFERDRDHYDHHGPDLRIDVREGTRRTVAVALRILSEADGPTGESPKELWRDIGRRRARQGVPLELVTNAFAMGSRMLWESLVARSAAGPAEIDDAVLLDAGRRVWVDLDVVNEVVIDAYRREHRRLQQQDARREQGVLDALVEGRGGDPEFLDEARSVLGTEPEDHVACVVALLDDDAATAGFGLVEDRLDRIGVRVWWHVRSGTYFGLLSGGLPGEDEMTALFDTAAPGRVGIALSADGLAGFAAAYLLATRAAETLPRGAQRVVSVTERLPQLLLAGSPHVAPLLAEAVGPLRALPDAHARTLLDTLEALLRHDGSATHAAEDLFCHRNTVIYRTKQIEQLTGRSLADPRDKMLLSLALLATGRS